MSKAFTTQFLFVFVSGNISANLIPSPPTLRSNQLIFFITPSVSLFLRSVPRPSLKGGRFEGLNVAYVDTFELFLI